MLEYVLVFAPVISNENLANLFINPSNSEYMSFVYFLKKNIEKQMHL